MKTKICTKCTDDLPLDAFGMRDGGKWPRSICKACRRKKHKEDPSKAREHYAANKDRILDGVKKRRKRYRLEALTHYSGGEPKCSCPGCDQTHFEFLTIDHINGEGSKHRRELAGPGSKDKRSPGGLAFYYWLRKNNYPAGFRVLCWNCNCSRGTYGYCPHESNNGRIVCANTKDALKYEQHEGFEVLVSPMHVASGCVPVSKRIRLA